MRFMILRKADAVTESGTLPGRDLLAAMGKYREDLMQAGVWRGGEGLLASVTGARLTFCGGRTSVTDGPFAESKELIAGFLVLDVASIDERSRGLDVVRRSRAMATSKSRCARSSRQRISLMD